MHIALAGLWHLGTVAATSWVESGASVTAWDPDEGLRNELRAGRGPVAEPGLDLALARGIARGLLRISDEPPFAAAPISHLAFDTIVGSTGSSEDPRLDEAVELFAETAQPKSLLLVSSQLPVGTCRRWQTLLHERDRGLMLAHAPENLRLGRALDDFMRPDRLLIGSEEDEAYEIAAAALAAFSATPIRLGLASAEMAKHATNAYFGLCIAFANDVAWLSACMGADPIEVSDALRADPRVSPSAPLRPGTSFSGATLTRDLVALRDLGERCGRPDLFAAVIEANERHAGVALGWLEDSLGSLRGVHLGVAGLTYKPGTSTLRDSLPLRLVSQVLEHGATVTAWDPAAEEFELSPGLTRASSLQACVRDADALAVLTALPELANVDWGDLHPAKRLVVDGCMGVDRKAAEAAGWIYRGLASG